MVQEASSWIMKGDFGRAAVRVGEQAIVEHAHRELQLIFKLGGTNSEFRVGTTSLSLDDLFFVVFNPWTPHIHLPNTSGATTLLTVLIEPAWIAQTLSPPLARMGQLFPRPRERLTEAIRAHANQLARAIMSHPTDASVACEDVVAQLVRSAIEAYASPAPGSDLFRDAARPVDYRIRKSLPLMDAQALITPRIGEIARQVGLSRSRFFEQFRRCVGVSPKHYVDFVRMNTAMNWLSTTDRPLLELAEELGFGAQSNFTRFFTQHTGVAPSDFRRQTRHSGPAELPEVMPIREPVAS
jgi:AraC-like DNA-binding protein